MFACLLEHDKLGMHMVSGDTSTIFFDHNLPKQLDFLEFLGYFFEKIAIFLKKMHFYHKNCL